MDGNKKMKIREEKRRSSLTDELWWTAELATEITEPHFVRFPYMGFH
jgi:hypothetical protein